MPDKIKESKAYKTLMALATLMADKRIDIYSACSAFYIFISFIPFVFILLSTVKYLPFSKQDLLYFMGGILPEEPYRLIEGIIEELYERGIGTLSLSIITAIWASAKGVLGITKGLNEINDVKGGKNFLYLRARSTVCTLLFMIGMILMLVVSAFSNTILLVMKRFMIHIPTISGFGQFRNILMFSALFMIFMFLYCVLPDRRINVIAQIPGAVWSAFVWTVFSRLFSLFLSTFKGYSMYGGFAVVLVTGVWLYTGMYIMFMGACINVFAASRKGKEYEGKDQ